ncbi:MAG TPA: GNAT family N-acetyltransferase [Stenotrophomonas sp.]|nr:GNAT family N-acetyltransferase [Stenotrophomonas sp.]
MLNIIEIDATDASVVRALYDSCGYRGTVSRTDRVIGATMGQALVGAVRLCAEEDVIVLRGMQVLPDYQRQGVGSQLLQACVRHLDAGDSYCLPYAHLAAFYGRAGFMVVQQSDLPAFLQRRLDAYTASGLYILGMGRGR